MKHFLVIITLTVFLHVSKGEGSSNQQSRHQIIDYIPFAALGRPINLKNGAMGSAPSEPFKTISYKRIYADTKFSLVENDRDINSILDINGKKAMDLKLGLGDGGRLIKTTTGRTASAELVFVHNTIQYSEGLKNLQSVVTNDFCRSIKGQYSHIITGIIYGSSLTISAQIQTKDERDEIKIVKHFTRPEALKVSFNMNVETWN